MDQRHPSHPIAPAAETYGYGADEIDLVDLAVVLVRRWRVMAAVFVVVAAFGLIAALVKGASYEYSAIVDIGQQADGKLLDSPEAVQAFISKAVVPTVAANAEDDDLRQLAAKVRVDAPRGSNTIMVKVIAPEAKTAKVDELFGQIRQQLIEGHGRHYDRLAKPLEAQVTAHEEELAALAREVARLEAELSDASAQARIALADRIGRLQEARRMARQELSGLRADLSRTTPTRMSEVPQRSLEKQGTSAALIVALAVVLGAMLAVFAAFFAEFAARVRARLEA